MGRAARPVRGLILFTAITAFGTIRLAAQEGARQLDFFLGSWEETSYDEAGNIVGKAKGEARWILDGTLMQHDYFGLDPAGNVVFRGTSIRTWIPRTRQWVVHWVMSNTPGYTYIDAVWKDGELHGTGHGFDGGGEFRERYRYWDITDSTYTFQLERTYDDGATWSPYPLTKAHKVSATDGKPDVGSLPLDGTPRIDGLFLAPDGTIYGAGTYTGSDVRPVSIGHLAYAAGALWATTGRAHRIFRVSLEGTVDPWAGDGVAENRDGARASAAFRSPNGLAAAPGGRTLSVATAGNGPGDRSRLRWIRLPLPTAPGR